MTNETSQTNPKLGLLKRFSIVCVVVSSLASTAFLILLPLSFFLELPDYADNGNSIEPNASISIGSFSCAASGGAIWLFTGEYPYSGSILTVEGVWGGIAATERTDWRWVVNRSGIEQVSHIDKTGRSVGKARYGDLPGVYYRHFEWLNPQTPWWTLCISLWYPIAITATLPSWWLVKRFGPNLRFKLQTLLIAMTIIAIALGVVVWHNS